LPTCRGGLERRPTVERDKNDVGRSFSAPERGA